MTIFHILNPYPAVINHFVCTGSKCRFEIGPIITVFCFTKFRGRVATFGLIDDEGFSAAKTLESHADAVGLDDPGPHDRSTNG